jgi:hypothetical protein
MSPPRDPNSKIGKLRAVILALLREHDHDNALPTSARFLFYELVQRGHLPKHVSGGRRADQNLHVALTDLRDDEIVPWDWIIDETRSVEDFSGYPSVKDGVLAQLSYIKIDPWRGNPPMIITESRSLAGALRPIADEYRCCIAATIGQCVGFLHTEIAPRLRFLTEPRVLYFGDFDLSGDHIEANTKRVLEQLCGAFGDNWERVALTQAQVTDYKLPEITKHDGRFKNGGTHQAVETEALSQTVLMDILRARLEQLIPQSLARVRKREAWQRKHIENAP